MIDERKAHLHPIILYSCFRFVMRYSTKVIVLHVCNINILPTTSMRMNVGKTLHAFLAGRTDGKVHVSWWNVKKQAQRVSKVS